MARRKREYLEFRDSTVRKANELIQRSRFNLSLVQQKILLFLIAQIHPYDEAFTEYEFNIVDFCRTCGIDAENGKNYRDLKAAIKDIADRSLWVEQGDTEILLRWISKAKINKNSGTVVIRLDDDMRPYLLQLQERYTQYELIYTLRFRSKYTIRLYELIQSIHFHSLDPYQYEFPLDKLRKLMGAECYTTWQHFRDRALVPSIREINEFSDKHVELETIKEGRSVSGVRLSVVTKDAMERIRIRSEIERELGNRQMTLWEAMERAEDGQED